MNKKNLRFYEAPMCDIVELKIVGMLCTSNNPAENPFSDSTEETPEVE